MTPVLRTKRLELRELVLEDDEFILRLLNEAAFLRFIGDKGVRTAADAREYLSKGPIDSYRRHGFGLYLTSLRGGGPIGICGLVKRDSLPDVDVGFAFLEQHWSKGYAAESAAAVLAWGMEHLRLPRIVAIVAPDNAGSIAVLQKIGLRFERMVTLPNDPLELKLFGSSGGGDAS
jgi:RimJ/RimL family protein N-acetyltransferase